MFFKFLIWENSRESIDEEIRESCHPFLFGLSIGSSYEDSIRKYYNSNDEYLN